MSEVKELFNELNNSISQFRDTTDGRLDEFAKDIEQINNRIDSLDMDGQQRGMGGVSGSPGGRESAEAKQYSQAFFNNLLKGQDALNGEMRNALSVGSAGDGGFWVPASTTDKIIRKVYETSAIRQVATVEPIPTDRLEVRKDLDEGTSGGWVGETESRSATTSPEVGLQEIPVHEQYAMPEATQKWLDTVDMQDAEGWLVSKISDKISRDENTAFVSGNGIAKPRGFTDYSTAATADDTRSWGTLEHVKSGANGAFKAAGSDPADCLFNCMFAMKEEYLNEATWAMQRLTLAAVAKLKDSNGNYLLGTARLQDKTPFELLGYPVRLFSDMPAYSSTGNLGIVFGNFARGYRIIDHKKGITVLRDPFTNKPYVRFYTVKRTGGDVANFEALNVIDYNSSSN